MENKKFYLSTTDKKIGGVCGGLAEYFEIDSLIVRVIVFCACFFGGLSVFSHLLIWLLASERPGTNIDKSNND